MDKEESDLRTLKGKAHGSANLRLEQNSLFYTPSPMDSRNSIGNLIDDLNIMKLFLHETFEFDFDKARERFIRLRTETFNKYFAEEMEKLVDKRKLAEKAYNEAKRIVRENLVPFLNGKRMRWTERLRDEITKQETPDLLTMMFSVAPALTDVQCITNPDKYIQWLHQDFADHDIIFRYERELTLEQKEDRVKANAEIMITVKPILKP